VDDLDKSRDQGRGTVSGLPRNVILLGVMGAGKSTIGWQLARILGFGFLDVDQWIEQQQGKPVHQIFTDDGEDYFRQIEHAAIAEISKVRNHVIAVGGGAVMDDDNWRMMRELGVSVWVNTPPAEIARRLVMKPDEVAKRPLLHDVVNAASKDERFRLLHDRIAALIQSRQQRYQEAQLSVVQSYSTPEAAAKLIKDQLIATGLLQRHEDAGSIRI
jgi:shikimate kinase